MVADLLLIAATLIWGGNYGVVKSTLDSMSVLSFVFARFSLAALIMGSGLLFIWPRLQIQRRHLLLLLVAGACAALYQVLFVVGLSLTTSTNSALLFAATPVVVTIIARAFGAAKVQVVQAVGMLLSFTGVYLVIVGGGNGGMSLGAETVTGDLITVVSVVLWALHIYANTWLLRYYPSTPLTALELVLAWFVLLPLCLPAVISQDWSGVTLAGWGGLLYAVLGSTVVCYSLWNYGIKRIGPVRTLVYQYLTPVFAVGFGVWLWAEQVVAAQIGGGLLVLLGVLLVRWDVFGKSRFVAE